VIATDPLSDIAVIKIDGSRIFPAPGSVTPRA